MHVHDTIIVFTKLPLPGKVKTRLVGSLTTTEAAELHLACLRDTIALVRSLPACRKMLMPAGSPPDCLALAKTLSLPGEWEVEPQRGRDLGARLSRAFFDAFESGARRVIAIGTDCPWMGTARVRLAFEMLNKADVVLGPAADGGYYLIGARKHLPIIFAGIPWGSGFVLQRTLLAIRSGRIRLRLLRRDFDLDRPQDLERIRELIRNGECRAEKLQEWLER